MECAVVDYDEDLGIVVQACLEEGIVSDDVVTTLFELLEYSDAEAIHEGTQVDWEVCFAADRFLQRPDHAQIIQAMMNGQFFLMDSYGLFMFIEVENERDQHQPARYWTEHQSTHGGGLSGRSLSAQRHDHWRMFA